MSMPLVSMRIAALLLLTLAMSACVTFERAPVAKLSCDPALAGEWRPVKDGPDRSILVSADCSLQWPEDDGGTYTTTLEGFALGGSRYLVFTPAVADRLMSSDGDMLRRAPKDSVYLARYRVDGDSAVVWLADPDEAMRPPAKGQATGVRIDETDVHVKGKRAGIAELLRARGDNIFAGQQDGKGVMRLQRVVPAAAP
ncbi:MAG: hypothetical protein V4673_07915 [Pseudomonadota bacterium]